MNEFKYGIQPMSQIDGAYSWRFTAENEAIEAAKTLSEKHNVEVIVFKIVGIFKRYSNWVMP